MPLKPTLGHIATGAHRNHTRYYGCVGHWLMHEGGGLKVFDCSGKNTSGTLTTFGGAIPTWIGGQWGSAVLIDGVNAVISMGNVSYFSSVTELSIAAWAQSNILLTTNAKLLVDVSGIAQMYVATTDNIAFLVSAGGISIADANVGLADTLLHHYVGVWTGANALLYVDGILQTDQPARVGTTTASAGTLRVGSNTTDRTWDGRVEEVRLYQRALTQTEVRSLYTDPFLEFRSPRPLAQYVLPPTPTGPRAGSLGLLGVGR